MLPAPRPRDGRLVLGMRARDLPRLHDLRPGRHPLPRPLGQAHEARRGSSRTCSGRTSRNPGIVTMTLIGINVGIYLLQLAGGAPSTPTRRLDLRARRCRSTGPLVAQGDWYRLLSAAFLHYGPIHLGLNMLALWWIGRPLENYLGPVRYLLLYLVSGLAGSAGALLAEPDRRHRRRVRRDLRNPRRRDRARAPGDLRARAAQRSPC